MASRKKVIASVLFVAALAVFALADGGDNNQNAIYSSTLVGATPGTIIGGLNSGGVPWTLNKGQATILSTGLLKVQVSGLFLAAGPSAGTTGPIQNVAATVLCGGGGGVPAASTSGVPLSSLGVAQINAQVTLPSPCVAPVVLVRIFDPNAAAGSQLGAFIALTGIKAGAGPAPGEDDHDD